MEIAERERETVVITGRTIPQDSYMVRPVMTTVSLSVVSIELVFCL